MKPHPTPNFCGRLNRREFLGTVGGGFPALALTGLLGAEGFFKSARASGGNPLAVRPPMVRGKAKSVIFLFMYGGPSHIDTFDYKPGMVGMEGKTIAVKTFGRGGKNHMLKRDCHIHCLSAPVPAHPVPGLL